MGGRGGHPATQQEGFGLLRVQHPLYGEWLNMRGAERLQFKEQVALCQTDSGTTVAFLDLLSQNSFETP